MCTVLLPLDVNPIAVKYISYHELNFSLLMGRSWMFALWGWTLQLWFRISYPCATVLS